MSADTGPDQNASWQQLHQQLEQQQQQLIMKDSSNPQRQRKFQAQVRDFQKKQRNQQRPIIDWLIRCQACASSETL
jgi:hypothetical protein